MGNPMKTYCGVAEDKYLLTSGKNADDRFHQLVSLVKKGGGDLLASPDIKALPPDFPAEVSGFLVASPGPVMGTLIPLMTGPGGEPAPALPPISGALGGYALAKGDSVRLEVFMPMEVVLSIKDAFSSAYMGARRMPPPPRPGGAPQPAPGAAPAPVPAPAPGQGVLPPVERRQVNKDVKDFPEPADLSTPETACAAWQRAVARSDVQKMSDLTWVKLDLQEMRETLRAAEKADPAGTAIGLRALAGSRIVEVLTWRGDLAEVITLLPLPPDKGQNPYSARGFGRINGQWKYLSEERLPTLEAAQEYFERKKGAQWKVFDGIHHEVAPFDFVK
jgi:hypothetical protein